MTEDAIEHALAVLRGCSPEERKAVFQSLRREFPIHPIEARFNAPAEVILEAINRSPDLTIRGIRGVIADAAFGQYIVPALTVHGWTDATPTGNHAYDYVLQDAIGSVSVQVKMQRQKDHRPMTASEGYRHLSPDMYVVETQRTRGGIDPATGENTRPYRFSEFDILAVSMHPSTNNWADFLYTVTRWLLPEGESDRLLKFQPVSKTPNEDWTADFREAVQWLRSGTTKRIASSTTRDATLL